MPRHTLPTRGSLLRLHLEGGRGLGSWEGPSYRRGYLRARTLRPFCAVTTH